MHHKQGPTRRGVPRRVAKDDHVTLLAGGTEFKPPQRKGLSSDIAAQTDMQEGRPNCVANGRCLPGSKRERPIKVRNARVHLRLTANVAITGRLLSAIVTPRAASLSPSWHYPSRRESRSRLCASPGSLNVQRLRSLSRIVEIDTTGGPGFGFEHFKQYDFLRPNEVGLETVLALFSDNKSPKW